MTDLSMIFGPTAPVHVRLFGGAAVGLMFVSLVTQFLGLVDLRPLPVAGLMSLGGGLCALALAVFFARRGQA